MTLELDIAKEALFNRILTATGQNVEKILTKVGVIDSGKKLESALEKKVEGRKTFVARRIGKNLGQKIVNVYNRKLTN